MTTFPSSFVSALAFRLHLHFTEFPHIMAFPLEIKRLIQSHVITGRCVRKATGIRFYKVRWAQTRNPYVSISLIGRENKKQGGLETCTCISSPAEVTYEHMRSNSQFHLHFIERNLWKGEREGTIYKNHGINPATGPIAKSIGAWKGGRNPFIHCPQKIGIQTSRIPHASPGIYTSDWLIAWITLDWLLLYWMLLYSVYAFSLQSSAQFHSAEPLWDTLHERCGRREYFVCWFLWYISRLIYS